MIFRLTDDPNCFPDPHFGEEDGLLAVGGDLSPERLTAAYRRGIFPWYGFKENEEILWWCPLDRFVILPGEIHISHSMQQLMKKDKYFVTIDRAFDKVIDYCSRTQQRREQEGAWLGDDMISAFRKMYKLGKAASVEVWKPSQALLEDGNEGEVELVGGLYGVVHGPHFFGESMFSLEPSASKLALIHLAKHIEPFGGIIDCQFETEHLKSMGGRHISYEEYLERLEVRG